MELCKLEGVVDEALDDFLRHDSLLLGRNGSEWSIAHRLAVYLEMRLPGWHIDCEYNRQGESSDPKKRATGGLSRPDIIVHRRGRPELQSNLLVIEIKKGERASDDCRKLKEFTSKPELERGFQYQYGLSISGWGLEAKPRLRWFVNGEEQAGG